MMFLDASALVAIIARESDATELEQKARRAEKIYASPVCVYEAALALARIGGVAPSAAQSLVENFLKSLDAEVIAITEAHAAVALAAFERFGKGRHPAALNMGDCFTYACAKLLDVPLLYKGDDFDRTDVKGA